MSIYFVTGNTVPPFALNLMPRVFTPDLTYPINLIFESIYQNGLDPNEAFGEVSQYEVNRFHEIVPKSTGQAWSMQISKITVDPATYIHPALIDTWEVIAVADTSDGISRPKWTLKLKRVVGSIPTV